MPPASHSNQLEIDCHAVKAKIGSDADFVLLDCRERDEFVLVRIDGARLLPMSEIQARVTELDELREREVVVFCHHGGRSLQVTEWLRQLGFAHVTSLSGGIDEWAVRIDPSLPRY